MPLQRRRIWVIFTSTLASSSKLSFLSFYTPPAWFLICPSATSALNSQHFTWDLLCLGLVIHQPMLPSLLIFCSVGVKSEETVIKYTWHDHSASPFVERRRAGQLFWTSTNLSKNQFLLAPLTLTSRNGTHRRPLVANDTHIAIVQGELRFYKKWGHLEVQTLELCSVEDLTGHFLLYASPMGWPDVCHSHLYDKF